MKSLDQSLYELTFGSDREYQNFFLHKNYYKNKEEIPVVSKQSGQGVNTALFLGLELLLVLDEIWRKMRLLIHF